MFKENNQHLQPYLISNINDMPEKQKSLLENSWAGTFYKEFFCREALKAWLGLSDEELYARSCYDLQVRYAVGYDRLGDGDFEIRTLYYFRERLSRYNSEQGINLLEKAFEQVTDQQITALKVRTGMQRTHALAPSDPDRQQHRVCQPITSDGGEPDPGGAHFE